VVFSSARGLLLSLWHSLERVALAYTVTADGIPFVLLPLGGSRRPVEHTVRAVVVC